MNLELCLSSLGQLRRRGRGTGLIVSTLLLLAVLLGGIASLSTYWLKTSYSQLGVAGFNRITLTASGEAPITADTMSELERGILRDCRLIPQLSTMIHLQSSDGSFVPFFASSAVDRDPTLTGVPLLAGDGLIAKPSAPCILISHATLKRLHADSRRAPTYLNVLVTRYLIAGKREKIFRCRVAGVTGDLGKYGVRLPLETMTEIRLFQLGLSRTLNRDHQRNLESLDEIHALHAIVSDLRTIPAIARTLDETGQFRLESPYFERGRERAFLSALVNLTTPVTIAFVCLVVWTISAVTKSNLDREHERMALMRMSGATRTTMFFWYLIPNMILSLSSAIVGSTLAFFIFRGPLGERVNAALEIQIFGPFSPFAVVASLMVLSMIAFIPPLLRFVGTDEIDQWFRGLC